MIGKVSAVVLTGLLVAAAAAAPDALARRGAGPGAGRPGIGACREQGSCRGDRTCDPERRRLRDGSCPQDPAQCQNPADCPGAKARGGRRGGAAQGEPAR